jgi:hypothetical protein
MIKYKFVLKEDYNYFSYGQNQCLKKGSIVAENINDDHYEDIKKNGYIVKVEGHGVYEYISIDKFDILKETFSKKTEKIS